MPAIVERASPAPPIANLRERRTRRGSFKDRSARLEIGLVNNMPDGAVAATERQFARLIEEASGEYDVRLRLFSLETLPRASEAKQDMAAHYRPARALKLEPQDALIVTGAEPRASDLPREPFWRELTFVLDWAEAHTISTLLSCLAAHAAVLHRDGIARRALPAKRSGVYRVHVTARHELMTAFEPHFVMPHSRHNDLSEADLAAKRYAILARSPESGVDIFVMETMSLLVFLQGHPEYDADTLAREYRRDMLRFLSGAAPAPPAPPAHYFPPPVAAAVADFAARAALRPSPELAAAFPRAAMAIDATPWRAAGVRLARNWLAAIARRKAARNGASFAVARWGG
jgi:homoserine O-succinyltransferase/O-acetyltransferase